MKISIIFCFCRTSVYMFSKHLGLAASIGISGILGDWLAVPFTVGIVF